MACATFDGQVVRHDPRLKELMDRFVCVRLVQANGLDLSLLQFDYDLTFAAFFLNADRTIYGRFGSRSEQKNAAKDISVEGFRKALEAALELHRAYPQNKQALAGKQSLKPRFGSPEDYPSLARRRQTASADPNVSFARNCIHCHMIGGAQRRFFRDARQPMPDDILFSYPMPSVVGLELDPKEKAKVMTVHAGSAADKAGFQLGDEITALDGEPVISIADVQWVLQNTPDGGALQAVVSRHHQTRKLTLALAKGWRRSSDISWRTTSWDLRRMAFGGLVLEDLPDPDRAAAGLDKKQLALRVKYVGEYGEHAIGKKAGFKKDDLLVSLDGRTDRLTESEALAYLIQNKMPGDQVGIQVRRGKETLDLRLPMQ